MDPNDISRWFGEYLEAFAACGRGQRDTASLLEYYGVPMFITTGDGVYALTTGDQVVAAMQPQIDGMSASSYDHSVILNSDVTVLNSASALLHASFSRQRSDGTEIQQITGTYLVTEGAVGRRISVLAIHSA